MIGGLILFILGGCVGACAVIINMKLVEARTDDLAKDNRKLQTKLEDVKEERITYEAWRAYRKGYHDGQTKFKMSADDEKNGGVIQVGETEETDDR